MIRNFDPVREEKPVIEEIRTAIQEVQDQGRYVLGPNVESLEKEVAAYCGTSYAIGVANCTDALLFAHQALGIQSGDEVIVPAYSSIATITGMIRLGIKPVFCDIEEDTHNIDCNKIESLITKKTKAILPVHIFGHAAEMNKIISISTKHNLHIIEDCAQAFGTEFIHDNLEKQRIGSFGVGCFSFFPTKNLGAQGDGGMLTTANEKIKDSIKMYRFLGRNPNAKTRKSKEHADMIAYNSRLDELQAAILRVKLKYFDENLKRKQKKANMFIEMLSCISDRIKLPVQKHYTSHSWHKFIVKAINRDAIISKLKERGIEALPMYDTPLHLHGATEFLGYKKGDLPIAEKASEEIISLPLYTEITIEEMEQIAKMLNEVVM